MDDEHWWKRSQSDGEEGVMRVMMQQPGECCTLKLCGCIGEDRRVQETATEGDEL